MYSSWASARAVGFLGRAQQVFLHHLVFASTAGGSLHPIRHLPVGVDLLDDAADDASTGHGGKGAADEHASLLGRATCAIKRGVDLGQIAVDRISGAGHHLVSTGQLPAQLSRCGLDLDQHPLDLLVGHANLKHKKTARRRHAIYCLGLPAGSF